MKKATLFLLVATAFGLAGHALAHHSQGMFDRDRELKLEGVIKSFRWTNPHSRIDVVAPDGQGGEATWNIEAGPPGQLGRDGWSRTSLKPGDKVELLVSPLRTGEPGGHLLMVTKSNGEVLYEGNFKKRPADAPRKP